MRLRESVAAQCRYGEEALDAFGPESELIWESSESDYQGSANILIRTPDGRFAHFEWTYGSCSGCDEWEARDLTPEEVTMVMRETAAWFDDEATLARYLEGADAEQRYPRDQSATAGSLPGMLRYLSGGIGTEFRAMGAAFAEWQAARCPGA
jgi:hypothetical protein